MLPSHFTADKGPSFHLKVHLKNKTTTKKHNKTNKNLCVRHPPALPPAPVAAAATVLSPGAVGCACIHQGTLMPKAPLLCSALHRLWGAVCPRHNSGAAACSPVTAVWWKPAGVTGRASGCAASCLTQQFLIDDLLQFELELE